MQVRRALDLQLRVVGGQHALHSPCEGVSYSSRSLNDGRLVKVLTELTDWTSAERASSLIAEVTNASPQRARSELASLVEAGILVSDSDLVQRAIADRADSWSSSGWRDAFVYHVLSDGVERVDYSTQSGQQLDVEMMYEYRSAGGAPPLFMTSQGSEALPLPKPSRKLGNSLHALSEVRTVRSAQSRPLSAEQLSTILWFGFGQTGRKKLPVSGEHIVKASPSGGSRHPTEAFVINLDSNAFPTGTYHYSVRDHALEVIDGFADPDWVDARVLGKPDWMNFNPSAVLLLSSRVEVTMYRYRENYSYRVIHHDAGHVLETAALAAKAIGCRSFRGYSLQSRAVSARIRGEQVVNPVLAFILLSA